MITDILPLVTIIILSLSTVIPNKCNDVNIHASNMHPGLLISCIFVLLTISANFNEIKL